VREQKWRTKEVFVPLSHRPGHAQVDFGETLGVIGGVECKIHFFVMSLPHSDAVFVKGYPAETTEAFCDGHVSAFSFFGGIPQSILYDNTKIAVARILGDRTRVRTRRRLCENCSLATTEAIISDVAQSRIPLSLQKWYSFA
jgi:transposase